MTMNERNEAGAGGIDELKSAFGTCCANLALY